MKYQIVGVKGNPEFSREDVISGIEALGFKFSGEYNANSRQRAELQGAPIFSKLCGPMYGGENTVRYETIEANDIMSR